jgi:hypothetical protein
MSFYESFVKFILDNITDKNEKISDEKFEKVKEGLIELIEQIFDDLIQENGEIVINSKEHLTKSVSDFMDFIL